MKQLIIFELANNHNGNVEHGLKIIRELKEVAKEFDFIFGFKLQYRDLETFIHKDYRFGNSKYVKRFRDTALSEQEFLTLKNEFGRHLSICTPFDEKSVELVRDHDFNIVKIASCSLTDWSLLDAISQLGKTVIASTAGSSLEEIRNVYLFFKHRRINVKFMHCIGKYPTDRNDLNLDRIDTLRKEFPDIQIGYSGHEIPYNYQAVSLAVAKGCGIFERHVAIGNDRNRYSSTPEEIRNWLYTIKQTIKMCGNGNIVKSDILNDLKRGAWLKADKKEGEKIQENDCYFAIPAQPGQLLANDFSRYNEVILTKDIRKDESIIDYTLTNRKNLMEGILYDVVGLLKKSRVNVPRDVKVELSHHKGLDDFYETGATIISCVNREYCKKLLVVLAGQHHPEHHHKLKEETFHILYGDLIINNNYYSAGDVVTIYRDEKHKFNSKAGCVFEEISTTHYPDDSYYEIALCKSRKTQMELRLYD